MTFFESVQSLEALADHVEILPGSGSYPAGRRAA